MNDPDPLTPGESYMLGSMIDRFVMAKDSGNEAKSRRIERKLNRIISRFYQGRMLEFSGEIFWVDAATPAGRVNVKEVDRVG